MRKNLFFFFSQLPTFLSHFAKLKIRHWVIFEVRSHKFAIFMKIQEKNATGVNGEGAAQHAATCAGVSVTMAIQFLILFGWKKSQNAQTHKRILFLCGPTSRKNKKENPPQKKKRKRQRRKKRKRKLAIGNQTGNAFFCFFSEWNSGTRQFFFSKFTHNFQQ